MGIVFVLIWAGLKATADRGTSPSTSGGVAVADLPQKHIQAIESLRKGLDAQTAQLIRQNEIMAAEGKWELLWKAHFAASPLLRLEAAVQLSQYRATLAGLNLVGGQPPIINTNATYGSAIFSLNNAFQNMEPLPESLLNVVRDSRLSRFAIHIEQASNSENSRLRLMDCSVDIGSAPFVDDFSFSTCLIRPQGKGTTLRNCTFDRSLVFGTPMGDGWLLERCDGRDIAIKSTGSRGLRGHPVDTKSAIAFARQGYAMFFEKCSFERVLIQGPSLIGFRNSRLGEVKIDDELASADKIPLLLSELIASDCQVESIEICSSEQDTTPSGQQTTVFRKNEKLTESALLWLKHNVRR